MPHPFYMRTLKKESPKKAVKSDNQVGKQIRNIFNNLGSIIKTLVKWR